MNKGKLISISILLVTLLVQIPAVKTASSDGMDSLIIHQDVGIKELNPQAALHVKGSIIIEDGSQGAGKILKSDSLGMTSWVDLSTIPGVVSINGPFNNITFTNSTINDTEINYGTIDNATFTNQSLTDLTVPGTLTVNNRITSDYFPWRLLYFEDFESAVTSWNINTRSTCRGQNHILGGVNVTSSHKLIQKFNLTNYPHTHIKVSFNFYSLNNWNNERAHLYVDGVPVWQSHKMKYNDYGRVIFGNCGTVGWANDPTRGRDRVIHKTVVVEHSSNNLELKFGSGLNDPLADKEAYGIDNIELWVGE